MKSNYGVRLLVTCLLVAAVACDNGQNKGDKGDGGDGGGGGSGINVTVTISGEGSVAVDGSTVCTSATDPCTLNVVIGSTTSITATPGEGFQFSSWNCSGTISTNATLDLVLASGAACTVTFLPISETLMVSISDGRGGTGGGVVNAGSIMCGAGTANVCSADYDYGTMVTLIASTFPNFEFVGWEGDCAGTDTTISFVIMAPMTCVAHFERIQFPLTLSVVGNGTLFASATSASGSCSQATCAAIDVDSPEVVTLTAQPGIGSEISAWTGDCVADASQNITQVTMSAARTCVVTFGASDRSLVLATTGGGSITHSPDGTDTGSAFVFASGTPVTLDAVADPNRVFLSWSGCSTSTDAHLVITMDTDKSCTANFGAAPRLLTVTAIGPGAVTSSPGGIDTAAADTTQSYDHGTPVTLTATPTNGFEVAAWGGDCANSDDPVPTTFDLAMSGNRTCTVTFKARLTVEVVGSGSVTSDASHVGIDTKIGAYEALYDQDAVVTLTAAVNTGGPQVSFLGWSGDCSGAGLSTNVTLAAARTCTATFTITPYDLTVAVAPSGGGNVVGQRNGTGSTVVNCGTGGSDCGDTGVPSNEFVRLVATPAAGYRFDAWSNCSTDTTATLDVPMNNNKACTANFTKQWTVTLTTLTGSGTVTIDRGSTGTSPDRTCSAGSCAQIVDSDETTTVTAIPANSETRISAFSCSAGTLSGSVYTITNPSADVTCTVTFAPKTVTVVGAGTNGAVAPASTVVNSGGAGVQLTATANANYHFTGWSGSFTSGSGTAAGCTGSSNPITVTISAATHGATYTCTASFAINSVTIVGAAGSNGSVAPASTATTVGAAATRLTATPDANYQVASWTGSGTATGAGCSGSGLTVDVSISAGSQSSQYTCTATFSRIQRNIAVTIAGGNNGDVDSAPAGINNCTSVGGTCSSNFNQGDSVVLTATPNANYQVVWSPTGGGTCDGAAANPSGQIKTMTFSNLQGAKACTATFSPLVQTITVTVVGNSGSVASTPAGIASCTATGGTCAASFNQGSGPVLTATPSANNQVTWSTTSGGTCDGTVANPSGQVKTMTFSNLQAAKDCTATFSPLKQTINVTATANGSVSSAPTGINSCTSAGGTCSAQFDQGSGPVLTATPSANYQVTWSATAPSGVCDGVVTNGTGQARIMTFTNLQATKNCTATFSRIQHTVAVTATANGSVSSSPAGVNSCTSAGGTCSAQFNQGDTVALTATPSANYQVVWSATGPSGVCDGAVTNGTGQARIMTFNSLNAAKACTATFSLLQYTVEFSAGAGGTGVTGSCGASICTVNHGTNVTLTANASSTPAPGYRFLSWSAGPGGACSYSANGQTLSITSNQRCVANFRARVVVTVEASPSGAGSVSGGGTYDVSTNVDISTSPNANFAFRSWSGCTSSTAAATSFTTPSGLPTSVTCRANYSTLWARSYGEPDDLPKSTQYQDTIRGIAVLENDSTKPAFGIAGTLDLINGQGVTFDRYAPTLLLPETGELSATDSDRQVRYHARADGLGDYGLSLYAATNARTDQNGDNWSSAGGVTIPFDDRDPITQLYVRPAGANDLFESVVFGYSGSSTSLSPQFATHYPAGDDKGQWSNFLTGTAAAPGGYYYSGVVNDGSSANMFPRVIMAGSDGSEAWDRMLCVGSKEYINASAMAIEQTPDGGAIGAGFVLYQLGQAQTLATLVFKLNSDGTLAWTRILTPSNTDSFASLLGVSIKHIPGTSAYLLTGTTYESKGRGYVPVAVEISDEGTSASVSWAVVLRSTSHDLSSPWVYSTISQDGRGAVLATSVDQDFGAVRLAFPGGTAAIDWQYSYGRQEDPGSYELPFAVVAIPSTGGYLLGGSSNDSSGKFTQGGVDMWALRIDDKGTTGDPVGATGFVQNSLDYKAEPFGLVDSATDCSERTTPAPKTPVKWGYPSATPARKHKTQAGLN